MASPLGFCALALFARAPSAPRTCHGQVTTVATARRAADLDLHRLASMRGERAAEGEWLGMHAGLATTTRYKACRRCVGNLHTRASQSR
ncbi:hypothetical protein PsYK624_132330 [Phanerochaete sordida]|uniref:Uncharacterized protein n=1 Tax=Phanerochaete sordida TaxID=48140 RepID=A0A9P3GJF8_9APHY|nr:hypothetical protein PsYK624_132330 [Phanerochaete sordida]